jgi:hypothetical protein
MKLRKILRKPEVLAASGYKPTQLDELIKQASSRRRFGSLKVAALWAGLRTRSFNTSRNGSLNATARVSAGSRAD